MVQGTDGYARLDDIAESAFLAGLATYDRSVGRRPWREIARPNQLPPDGDWRIWMRMCGRGEGKTRSGAETTIEKVLAGSKHVGIIAPTFADARDVCIEGESGLLACAPPGLITTWNRSMGELRFSTGAKGKLFAAVEPERLRGPQHDWIWADEAGTPQYTRQVLDMALFGLRLGDDPQMMVTTTPRPTPVIKALLKMDRCIVTRGRTRDNYQNLAPGIVDELEKRYEGTRLGRQELDGELLEDTEGALWSSEWFEIPGFRLPVVRPPNIPKNIVRAVVGVDPSITDPELLKDPNKDPDECGIVVVGLTDEARGVVLADLSGVYKPEKWARIAVAAYSKFRCAEICVEVNQGGALVRDAIRTIGPLANVRMVHASMGKRARAEPVAMLYEQGRFSHCGYFHELEAEQTGWDSRLPNVPSPNRIDALVWGAHGLGLCQATGSTVHSFMRKKTEDD